MYVKKAREVACDGRRVLCVNASSNISEVGHELAQGRPFSVTYYDGAVSRKWALRSTPDGVDVSEIARKFGGGGHKHASGFETDFAFLFPTVVPQQEAGDGSHG
jgi:oligoribonuclease NrnB/cAMP/cGMP phosphodiesterase (DHH superfamily)